jgi:hypothetical protein
MKSILRFVTAMVLVSGIAMTLSNQLMYAQVHYETGGGATLHLHGAAPAAIQSSFEASNAVLPEYRQANASAQMVIGILLILLGFFLHGLLESHEERTVPVKVGKRKKSAHRPKKRNLFWMEMQV